jgi:predicted permease
MLQRIKLTARWLLRKSRIEKELDVELQDHIERQTQQNIRLGMSPDEARLAARKAFGGVEQAKEVSRDVRGLRWVVELRQDLRYASRMLVKYPGFSLATVITLALGIGANTAIFSVVNALLLKPLAYPRSERIVRLFETTKAGNDTTVSPPNFLDWKARQTSFERLAAFQGASFDLSGPEGVEQITGTRVSADFFPLLGVQPTEGRVFSPMEDEPGGAPVIVLSHKFRRARFAGNANVIGQSIAFNTQLYTVIGVLPEDFEFGSPDAVVWTPLRLGDPSHRMRRTERYLSVIGLLRPQASLEQSQKEMDRLAEELGRQYPDANASNGIRLLSLQKHLFGGMRDSLLILLGAVGFVLLIACANLANLALARAKKREKEFAVRAALGASSLRLTRQLMTENLMLSLLGGALGLILARWGVDWLATLWRESGGASAPAISRVSRIGIDGIALGFTMALTLITGAAFGLIPARRASCVDLVDSLKDARRGAFNSWSGRRRQNALAVAEISLATALLVCAGLMVQSLWRLIRVNPGFDAGRVVTIQISAPSARIAGNREESSRKTAAFYREIVDRIKLVPGVEAADVINVTPLRNEGSATRFTIEYRPPASPADVPTAPYYVLGPDYFRIMRIPLRQGRPFTIVDSQDAPGVIAINETFARRYWPNEDPVGRRLRRGGLDSKSSWLTVVGVVGDVRNTGLDAPPQPEIYIPHAQFPWPDSTLVVRTAGDPLDMMSALRTQILGVDRNTKITTVLPMTEWLSRSVASRRFNMQLLVIFSSFALLLAGAGVYAVMSYAIASRTYEIGVRIALGAQLSDTMTLVFGQGIKLALVGIGIGLLLALAATRLLKTLIFGVTATDPTTFVVISLLMLFTALVACALPARRAINVDALIAMRIE